MNKNNRDVINPVCYDKLNEIIHDQELFTFQIYKQYKETPFSCYNFKKDHFDIYYTLDRANIEINEAKVLVDSKIWKKTTEQKALSKQKKEMILEEIIDAQKFLNQAVIQLGYNTQDLYDMHKKKSDTNRIRQQNNY